MKVFTLFKEIIMCIGCATTHYRAKALQHFDRNRTAYKRIGYAFGVVGFSLAFLSAKSYFRTDGEILEALALEATEELL